MKNIFTIILLAGFLLTGCRGGRTATNRFYILEYPRDMSVNIPDQKIESSCYVNPVEIYPAFSTNQIAYREDSHEIRFYAFNHWAIRPEAGFTRILIDYLDDNQVFSRVYHTSPVHDATYSIESVVQRLEVVRERNDYYAHIVVRFRLVDNDSGNVLSEHLNSSTTEMEEPNLNLFARSVSEMFVEEFSQFLSGILKIYEKT
jgi:ABC-type uncharacterized transport system auxiliary subunit